VKTNLKKSVKSAKSIVKKSTANSSNRKMSSKQKSAVERHRLNPQMKIVPTVDENPRRKGSHGFKSLQLILKARRKPLTVEQFAEKGGRLRDLHWDLNFGHVKLSGKSA
jgi:hypothetical protein